MLLRSSSTPLLRSLSSGSLAHSESLREVEWESDSPIHSRVYRTVSFSTATISPGPQNFGVADDTRSVESGDWDFCGDAVTWPRFRRAQSEGDLQSLGRGSALSAVAESLTTSTRMNKGLDGLTDAENLTNVGRQWCRRMAVRRQSSLSVIPSSSGTSRGSEASGSDILGFGKSERSEEEEEETFFEEVDVAESVHGSIDLWQRARDACPTTKHRGDSLEKSMEGGLALDGLDSEFRLVSDAAQGVTASGKDSQAKNFASVSGRGDHGFFEGASRGEKYSIMATGADGTMLVCNSRGSTSVTPSDLVGPMFIAGGFGMGSGGVGGRNVPNVGTGGGGGGRDDSLGIDAYYKRALEADPGQPLLLRNYARFLHEVKKDNRSAEPYYERAILANPGDGELLGLYAKLIWDVYKDEERAGSYFDRALLAAPENSYVVAAYASFMWSAEGDEETQEQIIHTSGHGANIGQRYLNSSVTAA